MVYHTISSSTAIGLRKYRIPSDLRSQAEYRLVSTTVGDHVGILGAVVFAFYTLGGPFGLGDFLSQYWFRLGDFQLALGGISPRFTHGLGDFRIPLLHSSPRSPLTPSMLGMHALPHMYYHMHFT